MSGESTFLSAAMPDGAVLWDGPVSDGIGGRTFDEPIEVVCRWEQKSVLFIDASGQEVTSQAVVYIVGDVDIGGYLYRGAIASLTPQELGAPLLLSGAREIRRVEKSRSLVGGLSLTKIFL